MNRKYFRKEERGRKQAVQKKRRKIEKSGPDLLKTLSEAVSLLKNDTEWIVIGGFPDNSLVARAEAIIGFEQVITKAEKE